MSSFVSHEVSGIISKVQENDLKEFEKQRKREKESAETLRKLQIASLYVSRGLPVPPEAQQPRTLSQIMMETILIEENREKAIAEINAYYDKLNADSRAAVEEVRKQTTSEGLGKDARFPGPILKK